MIEYTVDSTVLIGIGIKRNYFLMCTVNVFSRIMSQLFAVPRLSFFGLPSNPILSLFLLMLLQPKYNNLSPFFF